MYGVPQAGLTVPAVAGQLEQGVRHQRDVALARLQQKSRALSVTQVHDSTVRTRGTRWNMLVVVSSLRRACCS
jgi:hypothetical protein